MGICCLLLLSVPGNPELSRMVSGALLLPISVILPYLAVPYLVSHVCVHCACMYVYL